MADRLAGHHRGPEGSGDAAASPGWPADGAVTVRGDGPRRRNLSPWASWSLHLRSVVDTDPCPGDAAQVAAWRERVRVRLAELLGPLPDPVPHDIEVTEVVEAGDHLRVRVVFDVEATLAVPAYLLVPHARRDAAPATGVLAVHGHGPGKGSICGLEGPEGDQFALQLVRAGHVVLAPDLRCFGERRDPRWTDEVHKDDCDADLVAATMAGVVPLARNLWDLQRCVDVLAAHPLVDPGRVAVVGFSYGATLALFLAATDQRVAAAVVSGYLSSWRAAHAVPWNMCGAQVLPGQLGRLEHLDVAALVAPRPLLVESGTDDVLFPVDAARGTVARLRDVYAALGADPSLVVHDVFEGEHRWDGAGVAAFLARS